jgi:single-strand DNA-binding protein
MFETHLTVIGTLITPVNRRRLTDGTAVANFRVASNERRYDRGTESWTDGDSLYVSVACWRQLAENVHATFDIGDPIIVRGRLHTRNYEDKEGRRQTVTELEGLAVGPDLCRATARITRLRPDGTALSSEPRGMQPAAAEPGDAERTDDPWSTVGDPADEPIDDLAESSTDRAELHGIAVEAGARA